MTRTDPREDLGALTRNGTWLLGSRVTAMTIGLLSMPILMSALGLTQFGAWAVLLGGTFAFGTLELGMSSAVMRWATLAMMPESASLGRHDLNAIMSNSLACTTSVFAVIGVPVFIAAEPLAAWLNLPVTPLLSPGQCILLIYTTVAVMALLRCTMAPMLAARRFAPHASFTVLQSGVGSIATCAVAWTTHRLDLVLIANALSIIGVQGVAAIWTRRRLPWKFSRSSLDRRLAYAMLRFGAALQFSDVATFVMYQFDKLIISGVVAPMEVAHYEVASRTAQALGGVSNSPMMAFLPSLTERHGRNEDPSSTLLSLFRLTVIGAGCFLLLPLAVSPIGLFAWIGEVGYHAAGTFALLALAVVSSLLIAPLTMAAQAMGRASMEFRRAAGAMLINVPVAVLLIQAYGKQGAALGTLIASLVANALFAHWMLRALDLSWRRLMTGLWPMLTPILVVTALLAAAAYLVEPLVISSRWYMAPTAAALYAAALLGMLAWLWLSGAFLPEERAWLRSLWIRRFELGSRIVR